MNIKDILSGRWFPHSNYEPYFCDEMVELVYRVRNECDYLLATVENETLHPETLIENIAEMVQKLVDFCVEDEN